MPRSEPSASEENYLKAIYKHSENGSAASTNSLAQELGTTPASVTDMLKRLSDKDLVQYTPYRGVVLTPAGQGVALQTLRKHRLWEVFLVEYLHFSWDEVHETAEQLEHIHSPKLIEKLDEFLGFPRFDPHGDPIPDSMGRIVPRNTRLLADVPAGERVRVAAVLHHASDFLQFLDRLGLVIDAELQVIECLAFDRSLEVEVGPHRQHIILTRAVTEQVLVL
jgi:DtxR family Mn-dependent transcriptional regulator